MLVNIAPYILLVIKIGLLVLLLFYLVFSAIVLGKVRFLSQILETDVSPLLLLLVVLNFFLSLGLFLIALVVL